MFGEKGELLADEQIDEIIENERFMMTKHIYHQGPLEDSLPILNGVLEQLMANDGEGLDELFDQLMYENSEDSEFFDRFPEGFLFRYDDASPEYATVAEYLEIGQFTDIVELGNGYYIIRRIPLNYDILPFEPEPSEFGEPVTLRTTAAQSIFDYVFEGWRESLELSFTPEYESINLAEIFTWRQQQ